MPRYIFSGVLVLLSVLIFHYTENDTGPVPAQAPYPEAGSSAKVVTAAQAQPEALISLLPFGSSIAAPPDQAELIRKRKARMTKDNCLTPDKYFTMTVKQLTALGKNGDAFALVQLAERYWSEPEALLYDVDMDFSEAPRTIALRYYVLATKGGAGNIPGMVARRLADTGDMSEAAAWDMVSQQFPANPQQSGPEPSFNGMSYEQLGAAYARAQAIAMEVGAVL